jgi:hypothetical protein
MANSFQFVTPVPELLSLAQLRHTVATVPAKIQAIALLRIRRMP